MTRTRMTHHERHTFNSIERLWRERECVPFMPPSRKRDRLARTREQRFFWYLVDLGLRSLVAFDYDAI